MQKLHKLLVVGLGNVGNEYVATRHNIGFDIVDEWIRQYKLAWETAKLADIANHKYRGVNIFLIKPNTYMNLSGKAVNFWMKQLQISTASLLVIVDDIAFELGEIKLRMQGNHGGHNGLRNIQEVLNTNNYPRLRCGIGKDFGVGQQSDYVLGKWNENESKLVSQMITKSQTVIEEIAKSNFQFAMNKVNTFNKKTSSN